MRVGIDLRPLRWELSGGLVQFTAGICPALFRLAGLIRSSSIGPPLATA